MKLAPLSFFVLVTALGCSTSPADVGEEPVGVVNQALNSGFSLPFKCGFATTVTQGNNSAFSHNGDARYGFDFGVVVNTPLAAAKAGRVAFARNDVKPGNPCYSGGSSACISTLNYATIDHGDGTSTLYAHMNAVSVTAGQMVVKGQLIGLSGGTGWSTGPHTHLQRQTNCGIFVCPSIPMSFDDVAGAGVPVSGQAVKSQNSCSGDCQLGDGDYCGNNGVKGDSSSLYVCTNGTPAVKEKCAFGCKPMPSGTPDRCATASEAPPADAGAAPPEAGTIPEAAPAPPATLAESPTEAPESPFPVEESGCSVSRPSSSAAVFPLLGLVTVLGLVGLRRRRAASDRRRASAP